MGLRFDARVLRLPRQSPPDMASVSFLRVSRSHSCQTRKTPPQDVIIPRHKNSAFRTYITANSADRCTVDRVLDHKRLRIQLLEQRTTGLSGFGNGMLRKIAAAGSIRVSDCIKCKKYCTSKNQIDDTNPSPFHRHSPSYQIKFRNNSIFEHWRVFLLILNNSIDVKISGHQQSWGYEEGPSKGPGPPLLVAADF